ncbi:MAG: hypothetical protein WC996_10080 [Peptostreptococcales bacterium]
MKSLFGKLFDLNSDGELDNFEQTMECVILDELFSDEDGDEDEDEGY